MLANRVVNAGVNKKRHFSTRFLQTFFCGSKKTLASGVPMAQILFIGQPLGMIVLPIMIFHQIQLMVCGVIANYWSKQPIEEFKTVDELKE